MKEFVEDTLNAQPLPLYHFQRTELETGGEVDEWLVDKVLDHKIEGGKVKFYTVWEGHPPEDATWEEVSSFLPSYNTEFLRYCRDKGLRMDLVEQLGHH